MQQPPEGNYQNPPTQPPYQQPTQQPYNQPQTPLPPPPYQYGTYPPLQPPMMPRKPKRWPWIVAIIVAFIFGDIAGRGHTTTADTTAAAPVNQNNSISQTQPTQAPTKPLAWTTIETFSGNGNQKTAVFAVNDNWRIAWSCTPDPQANSIGGYDFYVSVDNSDTSLADWNALSGSCKPGSISTVTNEHQAGNVYLDVTSGGGPWTITVQEMK